MRSSRVFVPLCALLFGCGDGALEASPPGQDESASEGSNGEDAGVSATDNGTGGDGGGGTGGDGDSGGGGTGGDGDGDGDGDGGGTGGDGDGDQCDAPWSDPWIGSPCETARDCQSQGTCLPSSAGFPCGLCTEPCDQYCQDLAGTPTTFCIDQVDVGVDPSAGTCVSQCDPSLLGGDGCRDGYSCVALPRFMDNTVKPVCIPDEAAPPKSACMLELDALDLSYAIAEVPPESPESHPNLVCEIVDPVYLYPPVHNVSWRYYSAPDAAPVLVSCEMALAIERLAALLESMGCVEFEHIGTYNCRVVSGTDTLSQHSFATAIDLYGFDVTGLGYLTLLDDWEDNILPPVTPEGQWLRTLADTRYADGIFNIILTPDYNAAHDNHFHVDLTPGGDFYK